MHSTQRRTGPLVFNNRRGQRGPISPKDKPFFTSSKVSFVVGLLFLGALIGLNYANFPTIMTINTNKIILAATIIVGVGNGCLWISILRDYRADKRIEEQRKRRERELSIDSDTDYSDIDSTGNDTDSDRADFDDGSNYDTDSSSGHRSDTD